MPARYFNGKDGKPIDVILSIGESSTLLLKDSNFRILEKWHFKNIKIVERPENNRDAILTLKIDPNKRLNISPSNFKNISKILTKSSYSLHIPASLKFILISLLLAIFTLIAIYRSIPYLSKQIAQTIPYSWNQKLGSWSSKAIHSEYQLCDNKNAIQALEKIANKLKNKANIEHEIHLYVINHKQPNAFAAAGGHVTIFSQLIKEAKTENEIAGVLSHELSHAKLKHPTESLVRSLGSYLFLNMVFGNTGSEDIILLANSIKQFKYSKEAEKQADKIAVTILENAGYTSDGLISFFKRMEKQQDIFNETSKNILYYFSTHPITTERIKEIRKHSLLTKNKNQLSEKEWQSLRKICD